MVKLIVGLGNPGPDYTRTRHNAGFWFVDRLAERYHCQFSSGSGLHGESARLGGAGRDCRLFKPLTFMNDSGRGVQAVLGYYRIDSEEMLVAHDEIDLTAGAVRLKRDGGHGGHNGLRDIMACTGAKNFLRLRIGVGHPGHKDAVTPHVLGRPGVDEQAAIDTAIEQALAVMPLVFEGELQKAINELHSSKG